MVEIEPQGPEDKHLLWVIVSAGTGMDAYGDNIQFHGAYTCPHDANKRLSEVKTDRRKFFKMPVEVFSAYAPG